LIRKSKALLHRLVPEANNSCFAACSCSQEQGSDTIKRENSGWTFAQPGIRPGGVWKTTTIRMRVEEAGHPIRVSGVGSKISSEVDDEVIQAN
jgi:hypothetical protein